MLLAQVDTSCRWRSLPSCRMAGRPHAHACILQFQADCTGVGPDIQAGYFQPVSAGDGHEQVYPDYLGMVGCMACSYNDSTMHKTTVYLTDELKAALECAAAETRRTESEIIREGLQLVLAQRQSPPPRSGIFDSGDPSLSEHTDELLAGFGHS